MTLCELLLSADRGYWRLRFDTFFKAELNKPGGKSTTSAPKSADGSQVSGGNCVLKRTELISISPDQTPLRILTCSTPKSFCRTNASTTTDVAFNSFSKVGSVRNSISQAGEPHESVTLLQCMILNIAGSNRISSSLSGNRNSCAWPFFSAFDAVATTSAPNSRG